MWAGWVTGSTGLMRRVEEGEMVFVMVGGVRWYMESSFSFWVSIVMVSNLSDLPNS